MIDTGPTINGVHSEGKAGQTDNRGGTEIITADPQIANEADIYVAHAGYIDQWIVPTQAPVVWILHGRPGACFRPEQFGSGNSYSLLAAIAKWPRVKKMVTFWPYHVEFWGPIVSREKLVCFDAPPIDGERFSPEGEKHDFESMGGIRNVLICESWREDVDIYEITHGMIAYAKRKGGVKFHFVGVENKATCWNFLFDELRRLNALGEVWGRRPEMEVMYRSVDLLLSPQKIVTRTIGEAIACGTPVVAAYGCEDYALFTMAEDNPEDVADALESALKMISNEPDVVNKQVDEAKQKLSLAAYSERMNAVYTEIS